MLFELDQIFKRGLLQFFHFSKDRKKKIYIHISYCSSKIRGVLHSPEIPNGNVIGMTTRRKPAEKSITISS